MRIVLAACSLLLLGPGLAAAQMAPQDKGVFVAFQGVFQGGKSTTGGTIGFPLYDEEATSSFSQEYGRGGGISMAGGYRVWKDAYAGAGYALTCTDGQGTVSASLPHPVLYGAPRTATGAIEEARQWGRTLYIWAGWRMEVAGPLEVLLTAGPAFVTARRDVAVEAAFDEGPEPFTTVTLQSPRTERRSKSAAGAGFGATFTYRLHRYAGASATLQYIGVNPKINGVAGTSTAKVGGLSLGMGFGLFF